MGFLDAIVGGVTGFLSGGPLGAGVGLLGGITGGGNSGGQQAAYTPTRRPSYADTLRQAAYMRSFMDAAGPPQLVPQGTAYATTQQQQQRQQPQGGVRQAKQEGGQGDRSPANIMRRRMAQNEGLGAGTGTAGNDLTKALSLREWLNQMPGRSGQPQSSTPTATSPPTNEQLFQNYLSAGIQGQNTLPTSAYQQAMARGTEGINQQAMQSRMMLQRNLGSRGLLHSGLYARGFGEIERGRLGGISDLAYDLQAQELSARRRSQETAANILAQQYLTEQEIAANQRLARMNQPTTGEYIGSILGTVAQGYIASRYRPNYTSFLAQPGTSVSPSVTTPTYYVPDDVI